MNVLPLRCVSTVTFSQLFGVFSFPWSCTAEPLLSGLRPVALRLLTVRTSASSSRRFPKNHEESRNTEMPKKVKGHQSVAAGSPVEAVASGPVTRDRSGAVCIVVYGKPSSKHSAITDVTAETVDVSIAAPPTDGEANSELLRFLAEVLQLKKSQVSLDKGCRSRDKLVRVESPLSPEEVLKRLQKAAG